MPSLNRPFACLLWDVDGTMVDTTALIVASLDYIYLKHYGRSLPVPELRALIGTPLRKQIRVFGEPEEFQTDPETVTQDFIHFYESHRDQERILHPVISLLIEGKRQGYPTALVTSKNREELQNTLPRLGIADFIDLAVTADDVHLPKPHPEGLLQALSCLHIAPDQYHQAVYIGDTVHDMQAARAAGVQAIGVTWGAATRSMLEDQSPSAVCDTPQELTHLLFE